VRPPPELSVIIPAYNEELRLPGTLEAVCAWLDEAGCDAEVLVVDDGSSDGTAQVIQEVARREPRIVPVLNPVNVGKGHAVQTGVARAAGTYVVFFDADLSYDLGYVAEARRRLDAGAHVVVGARDLTPDDARRAYAPTRRLASRAFNAFVDALLGLGVPDTQCGFKAFRADVARPLFAALTVGGFGFDVELLYLARRWELRLERMPVVMTARAGGSVSVLRHSARMARDVWRIRRAGRRGDYPQRPTLLG